jgi:DNA-binding transcriptional ArsR family regulator
LCNISALERRQLEDEARQGRTAIRTLGDPTRLSILLYLAERPTSVGELALRFELAQPTVSAHLRARRGSGLVAGTRTEGRTVYQVEQDRMVNLLEDLAESAGIELSS